MSRIIKFATPPTLLSFSAVGGYEERRGPLGDRFDLTDPTEKFGQKTWECAEAEMSRLALNIALGKLGISHTELDLIVAGDLQNQCVASAIGLSSFGVPYLGVYGACSTATESLAVLSLFLSQNGGMGAAVTSSHNSAAERQFRNPIEYGGQRTPTAQWTATAAGAFLLSGAPIERGVRITECMAGRMIDGGTTDATNMGAAMAFAAADSIITYFEQSKRSPTDFDYIVTGDLGAVGTRVLYELLSDKYPSVIARHLDCGNLLYDLKKRDVHSGASGCGTSAAVLSTHFLPMLSRGEIGSILLLSTGALMSPSSVLQGQNIIGIAPAIRIEGVGLRKQPQNGFAGHI